MPYLRGLRQTDLTTPLRGLAVALDCLRWIHVSPTNLRRRAPPPAFWAGPQLRSVGRTSARKGSGSNTNRPPHDWGKWLLSTVSHSRPIFTSSWHFDFETAIWDSPAWSYDPKRLGNVLHRQSNGFRDGA